MSVSVHYLLPDCFLSRHFIIKFNGPRPVSKPGGARSTPVARQEQSAKIKENHWFLRRHHWHAFLYSLYSSLEDIKADRQSNPFSESQELFSGSASPASPQSRSPRSQKQGVCERRIPLQAKAIKAKIDLLEPARV